MKGQRVSFVPSRQTLSACTAFLALMSLPGCATLGGHVRGSFSCNAPGGICAPTSKIDEQALALIEGQGGTSLPGGSQNDRTTAAGVQRMAAGGLARSSDKVVRIVFPAFIDKFGRYHETSAIHAVVERGAWMQVTADRDLGAALADKASIVGRPSLAELASNAGAIAFPSEDSVVPIAAAAENVSGAPSAAHIRAARAGKGAAKGKAVLPHSPAEIRAAVEAKLAKPGAPAATVPPPSFPAMPGIN